MLDVWRDYFRSLSVVESQGSTTAPARHKPSLFSLANRSASATTPVHCRRAELRMRVPLR